MSVLLRGSFAALLLALVASMAPVQDPEPLRFTWVDLLVDPGGAALAAWQLELDDPSGRARVAGVEGGEHPAFGDPPHYDPEALRGGRVVLAAFHTGDELPSGPTRVARVHLAVRGDAPVPFELTIDVAAGPGGEPLEARADLLLGD